MLKIGIGADHAGFAYKQIIMNALIAQGYIVQDFGTHSESSVDYPDYVHPLAIAVDNKALDFGIVVCGSGNGVAITANKYQGVRAALCWVGELASLARQHNDANILAIPARFVTIEVAQETVQTFLVTSFEGGRHQKRVDKITTQ